MFTEVARRRLVGCAVVAAGALAMPALAQAEVFDSPTSGTVTVGAGAQEQASPYPSEVRVEGGDGPIVDVNVTLALTHTFPDDLDILLVSPEGDASILMSDVCDEGDLGNAVFFLDQDAGSDLPNSANCAGGTFRPTDGTGFGGTDNWPAPGPGAIGTADLDNFVGGDPNGQWRLFMVDDAAGQAGSIQSWSLRIRTEAAQIAIPAGPATEGIANPYPSVVNAPAPDGQVITDLNVTFNDFNHMHPDDVDMVIQGPGGQTAMLMSDACGSPDMHNLPWAFTDEALPLGDSDGIDCFTFAVRPTAFGDVEDLPAPAPAGPYGTSLSVFDGLGGGDWRLFINDDSGSDTGWINGWSLDLETRPAATTGFSASAVATAEGQTATLQVTRAALPDLGPATLNVDTNHSGTTPADLGGALPTQLQFARGETTKTIAIPINSDFEGEGAEDFVVSLSNPVDDALLADATSSAVVTIAASPPDNRFTVGEVTRLPNGRATVSVTIPNPGTLTAADAGPKELLKPTEVNAERAGQTTITLKPAKKAKRKLKRGKKVKLTAELSYTPFDGLANSAQVPVKLKRSK